ncbi:PAS domain-containing sensor histidine kinase [soil metagenome]
MALAVLQSDLVRGRLRTSARYLFGIGFTVASCLTALAIWLVSSAPKSNAVGPPSATIVTLLWANLALILVLGAVIARRVFRLFETRESAGVKLHLRFVTLFAGAAVVPAVVVALFFGLLVTKGIASWFSAPMQSMVSSSRVIAQTYVNERRTGMRNDIDAIIPELNRKAPLINEDRAAFNQILEGLVAGHYFDAVYVLNSRGEVIARGEGSSPRNFDLPSAEAVQENRGDKSNSVLIREDTRKATMGGLYPLTGYADASLYVVKRVDPTVYGFLRDTSDTIGFYNDIDKNRAAIQSMFQLSYAETALLVLIGAISVGMAVATSISRPVARLVEAADRVAGGDLTARVETGESPEEIEVLSEAFNRMAGDLQDQQAALRAASLDAESRRQFIETVLFGVSAGVLSLDAAGRVSACNRQAITLLGLSAGTPQGMSLAEAAPELALVVARADEGGEAETEIDVTRGGETRRLRVRATSLAEGGQVLTFDDVTRLMAAQRNAAWRDVARRIAHEIKNPLTPIQLSAERIRRKYRKDITSDIETFDRCTDTIIRQVGDIGRMVDEFSSFARMPAPQFTRCDPAEMLRQAVFARRVADPDIAVEMIEPVPGVSMVCDERMVGQALGNVLKNAAEAIAAKRLRGDDFDGRIVARLMSDLDGVYFEVTDNGVGLPVKDRDRLTEPYVTTREKGTGLGLAIVKRIVEDHHGALTLQDAPDGQGARVTLTFPPGRALTAPAPIAAEA